MPLHSDYLIHGTNGEVIDLDRTHATTRRMANREEVDCDFWLSAEFTGVERVRTNANRKPPTIHIRKTTHV